MSEWRPVGGQIKPGATLRQGGRVRSGRGGGQKPGWRGPFGWNLWQTAAAVVGAAILAFILLVMFVAAQLPDPSRVQVRAGEIKIFDRTGTRLVADVTGSVNRTPVALKDISPQLQHATVAAEDRHFYENRLVGIDFGRLAKALTVDLIRRQASQGASTITQQLAKNELLTTDRTLTRKFKEAILATEIEQRFSKDDILALYLNSIYYGHHAYGAQAAAKTYFDKDAKDLTVSQASLLAGLPQAPSYYDPQTNYAGAKSRQAYVLGQMVRNGYISQAEADAAKAEDLQPQLKYKVEAATGPAPHFVEYVKTQMESIYGADIVHNGGLQITSSLDLDVQNAANAAIASGVPKLGHGVNNGAMLVTDPKTGQILAMVGSADFNNVNIAGQVNITNTGRQPGSSFKPYVYLTGISNKKFDMTTVFHDSPGVVPGSVFDFDNRFLGTMHLRTALVKSRNVPAEEAMLKAGPGSVVDMAHKIGITSPLESNLATAIGGVHTGITMIDHSVGYGVLANGGKKQNPSALLKVISAEGRDITQPPSDGQQVVDAGSVFIVNDVLRGYDKEWGLGFDRPLAAKSGTTNVGSATGDGWLMSYNPQVVIAAWAGHTSNDPTVGNATNNFFGVSLAQPVVDAFLKLTPGRWKADFPAKPDSVSIANCGSGGLSVGDPGPVYVLTGSTPSCTPPSPSPTSTPSVAPTQAPAPSPTPPLPSPIIVSPPSSPRPGGVGPPPSP